MLAKNTVVNAGDAPAAASAVDARTVRSGYFSRPAVAINIESIETDAAAVDRSAEATRTKVEVHVFKRRQATDAAPSHAQSFDHYYEQSASVAQMSAARLQPTMRRALKTTISRNSVLRTKPQRQKKRKWVRKPPK